MFGRYVVVKTIHDIPLTDFNSFKSKLLRRGTTNNKQAESSQNQGGVTPTRRPGMSSSYDSFCDLFTY
jgi:hypothetical protein